MSKQYFELSTDEKGLHFYRAIPDPTVELQHSLTQALNEADELREKDRESTRIIQIMEKEIDLLRVDVAEYKKAQEFSKKASDGASLLTLGLKQRVAELDSQNNLLNQILTSIAKQLGFDHFDDEQVAIAIEELQAIPKWEQLAKEWKTKSETAENTIATLQDNLTRSQSDRLSELTTIMRMIQALSNTPQDCYYGAIRLIHQVIYDQICRLDPTLSLDI